MSKKRDAEFDIAKGILILCVVIGHGGSDSIADFMYRFHMPLFFILSGYFMQKHSNVSEYAKSQFKKLMIPYFVYMVVDFIFFDHLHDLNRILHYLWVVDSSMAYIGILLASIYPQSYSLQC